jgi:Flp pilus assembly protein TadG
MEQHVDRQRGQALVELALLIPVVMMLLLGVIELSNAINAYLTISEASRSGARLAVLEGKATGVDAHVRALTERLPASNLTVNAYQGTDNKGSKMYTVEVQYEYRTILNHTPFLQQIMPNPLTLTARTAMPAL